MRSAGRSYGMFLRIYATLARASSKVGIFRVSADPRFLQDPSNRPVYIAWGGRARQFFGEDSAVLDAAPTGRSRTSDVGKDLFRCIGDWLLLPGGQSWASPSSAYYDRPSLAVFPVVGILSRRALLLPSPRNPPEAPRRPWPDAPDRKRRTPA